MAKKIKSLISFGRVAENRKARHNYIINETIEAGVILTGSEVKSLRFGQVSIKESYVSEAKGKLVLINSNIPEYGPANQFNHPPKRFRELLVTKKQRNRLFGLMKRDGVTLIPLTIFFNNKGFAKLDLGIAKGRKKEDKRDLIKQREWDRKKQRILKEQS